MSTSGETDAPDDEDGQQSVEERLADLEEEVEYLRTSRRNYREQVIRPSFDELKAESDDARDDRAELRSMVEDMQETIATLQQKLENIAGVDDPSQSSPKKRRQDLRHAMIREAESLDDDLAGIKWYYKEVQKTLAHLNHGEVDPKQCYRAMEQIARNHDGFEISTKMVDGREVDALKLDSAATMAEGSIDNVNNGEAGRQPAKPGTEPQTETTR